jgi:hypothetical protein
VAVPARAIGVLLFLPVPLVLFLFTRAPLGILASLGIGILLMLTHRLYARPWALAHAHRRCLWCGADVAPAGPGAPATPGALAAPGSADPDPIRFAVDDPLGRAEWRACQARHSRCLLSVLKWAAGHGRALSVGIPGTLAVFLVSALASALGWTSAQAFEDTVAFFQLGIAFNVLPLGWLAWRAEPAAPGEALRAPFPLHVPALVGLWTVLWLFRLVGLLWLVQGTLHVSQRAGWIA